MNDLATIDKNVLERMEAAPKVVSGFFVGMQGIEVADGVTMYGSPDLIKAWKTYHRLQDAAKLVERSREEAIHNERVIMGDTQLPLGAEVVLKDDSANGRWRNRIGKIMAISTGARGRPLYCTVMRGDDGTYPAMATEGVDKVHVYARQLVDYGLTILQAEYHVH